jgi:hypothetical protein
VLISTITIEPMAYMKKPSKKMYGGNKKTTSKNGSFLEPNKELSFGGVKTMATGGGRPNESPVDSAAAARRGAENAAKKRAEEQRLARQKAAKDGSTMDKIGVMGTGATSPKPQDVGATRAIATKTTTAAKKPAAAKTSSSYADAKKKNPNLDKLIKERKGLTRGTVEYNRVQNQINKAYGKGPMRTEINKIAPKPATKNPERNPTIKSSTPAKPAAKPAAKKPVAKVSTKPTASRTGMSPQGDTRALQAELKSAAPAASAKKPIDRRNARSARKTDRLKKRVGRLQGKMQAGGKR